MFADGRADVTAPAVGAATSHPHKAVSSFDDDPAEDNYVGPIASSTKLPLLEIKVGQWRGGVWYDRNLDVCWVLVAGLAKGGHEDRDDFYQCIARDSSDPSRWMPTDTDVRLVKRERAALLLTEWEMATQQQVLNALRDVCDGGESRFELPHPAPQLAPMATVTIAVARVREDASDSIRPPQVGTGATRRPAGADRRWPLGWQSWPATTVSTSVNCSRGRISPSAT